MPDLLGVTNAVPGNDTNLINRNMPQIPNDPRVQNAPDPNRVVRPDNRSEQQGANEGLLGERALRYDSNFITFLQRLNDTPDLVRTMTELLRSYQGTVVSSGMGEGIATEMSAVLEMLQMDEGEFMSFFQSQMEMGTRFSGPLFSILREAYGGAATEAQKSSILQFLKRYTDFSASPHVQGNLLRTLTKLTRSIPATYGNQLLGMVSELEGKMSQGDRPGALKLLQGTIMPFLGSYTSRTNDMGLSRTLISLLSLDVARYESGSLDGVMQAFRQLGVNPQLRAKLGGLSEADLQRLLEQGKFARAVGQDQFAGRLAHTAARALRGGAGAEAQEAFRNILSAFLVNESVYMPLTHLILPMEWQGRMMFSELWVDPDAEDNLKHGRGDRENTIRFLFKIDIQDLGFFDMVLTCRGENVDIQLFGPPAVASFAGIVQGELGRILTDNGLNAGAIQVQETQQPLTISQVFPKIFEGANSINVKA
ncbi:MAG: hypothetical protein K2N78_02340 [Oscillospiraceae bacterium]|nr:hypothetical protein [Oscillospiraceae bacterium]